MNETQAVYPFVLGWIVTVLIVVHSYIHVVRSRSLGFNETQWDVAIDVLSGVRWKVVIGTPFIVGLVVEAVWWLLATLMGVPLPF